VWLTVLPQASTSTVRGTVRDQSGAFIPNASVSITNTGTNITSRSATDGAGFYVFPGINPGPYRIEIEAPGMQKFEGTLTVMVQQVAVVDAVLQVERWRIEQLPIDGRDFGSLLQTVPGMEGWRALGLRTGSHEFMLDGAPMANRNSMMSWLFNRPSTAIVTTKSGTNLLHGTAFETARNNGFGVARARTDYCTKPPQPCATAISAAWWTRRAAGTHSTIRGPPIPARGPGSRWLMAEKSTSSTRSC